MQQNIIEGTQRLTSIPQLEVRLFNSKLVLK